MSQFLTPIFLQGADSSANPLTGAKLYIYQSGTTTLLSLFSDDALVSPIANPIVADAAGVFAGAFLEETTFKAILKTSADVTLYTRDPVYSIGQADDVSAANVSFDGTELGFSSDNLQDAITELANSFVAAPPTTVDNTLPRFNGTDGQIQTTGIVVADTSNDVSGIGQITQTATGANTIPVGTTAQRPGSPADGMIRYNSTTKRLEHYGDAAWRGGQFESTQQTITAAGALTLAHGLGVAPKLYMAVLQCTTAELGYSIGDEIAAPAVSVDGSNNRGCSLKADATNITVRFGAGASSFSIIRGDTGVHVNLTNTSWRLVVRAWA